MRKRKMLAAFLAAITIASVVFVLTGGDAKADVPIRTVSDVVDGRGATMHTGFEPVHGASILLRDKDGISFSYESTALPEGAYSVWLFVFNNPEGCHHARAELGGECGFLDVFMHPHGVPGVPVGPDGGPSEGGVMWGTGGLVGPDGMGDFQARIEKDNPPGPILRGPGLVEPRKAEIQIIARHHGPLVHRHPRG